MTNIIENVKKIQDALIKGDGVITIADEFGRYEINKMALSAWSADEKCKWIVYLQEYDMVNVHYVDQLDITWEIVS